MARAISRFVSPCHTKSATCIATPSPKLRQLARRDKYPLLLRLQFPNASSERRALPESGTSVLEWNCTPDTGVATHAESRTSNRDGGRVSFSLSKRNEI